MKINFKNVLQYLNPAMMILHRIAGNCHQLDISLLKLWHQLCHTAQLSGANWGVVSRMGEQDAPAVVRDRVRHSKINPHSLLGL